MSVGAAPMSSSLTPARPGTFAVSLFSDAAQWAPVEAELDAAGVPLALFHRSAWAASRPSARFRFVCVRDAGGRCVAGFAAELTRSRALPGHDIMRVERLGEGAAVEPLAAGLRALVAAARADRRVIRVAVEVMARDEAVRQALGEAMRDVGLTRAPAARCYERTIGFGLRQADDILWASITAKARKDVRAIGKHPVAIRPILDDALAPRLDALMAETRARTGGEFHAVDWRAVTRVSRELPARSNLLGLFHVGATEGRDELLSFMWACHHGEYAHYDHGASTRQTALRCPLMYALLWEQMLWAKRHGAAWFDLGGVSQGSRGDNSDPLGGISDFKRNFSQEVVTLGEDWVLEPSPARARVAHLVGAGARWIARVRPALGGGSRT